MISALVLLGLNSITTGKRLGSLKIVLLIIVKKSPNTQYLSVFFPTNLSSLAIRIESYNTTLHFYGYFTFLLIYKPKMGPQKH